MKIGNIRVQNKSKEIKTTEVSIQFLPRLSRSITSTELTKLDQNSIENNANCWEDRKKMITAKTIYVYQIFTKYNQKLWLF